MENNDKKKKEDSIFYSIKGFICLEKSRSQLYLLSNDYHNKGGFVR